MLPDNVIQARNAATEATKTANTAAAGEPSISDVLRQKVTEAYSSSQDIVKPLDVATKNYLGAPQAGREKYQNIFNPFQRENLVSQYVGNESLPMLSLSSILGQRFGRIEDTIGAGTRAYQADVAAKQGAAQLAKDLYDSLLTEYNTVETNKLAREKFEYDKKKGSGDGAVGMKEALSLLGMLRMGTTGQTTTSNRLPIETAIEEDTTPAWQDPLRKLQQEQQTSKIYNNAGGINLSGIKGLNSNVRY